MAFMLARVIGEQAEPNENATWYLLECQFIRRIRVNAGRWARALRTVHTSEQSVPK